MDADCRWALFHAGSIYAAVKVEAVKNWPSLSATRIKDDLADVASGQFDFEKLPSLRFLPIHRMSKTQGRSGRISPAEIIEMASACLPMRAVWAVQIRTRCCSDALLLGLGESLASMSNGVDLLRHHTRVRPQGKARCRAKPWSVRPIKFDTAGLPDVDRPLLAGRHTPRPASEKAGESRIAVVSGAAMLVARVLSLGDGLARYQTSCRIQGRSPPNPLRAHSHLQSAARHHAPPRKRPKVLDCNAGASSGMMGGFTQKLAAMALQMIVIKGFYVVLLKSCTEATVLSLPMR